MEFDYGCSAISFYMVGKQWKIMINTLFRLVYLEHTHISVFYRFLTRFCEKEPLLLREGPCKSLSHDCFLGWYPWAIVLPPCAQGVHGTSRLMLVLIGE